MRGIKVKTGKEVIELKEFKALKGKHCESSAMMNALSHHGVKLSENLINGFASSMSFGYGGDASFPMIMMRVGDFKERFSKATGIKIIAMHPQSAQEAYDGIKELLSKNIAVVLRVNMRYLPYLHGGKYGAKHTSFGWHFVTLVKLDEIEGCAWVTDTEYSDIQKIKISDLAKARDSKEGELKADNYFYYFDNPELSSIDFKGAFKTAMESLVGNYEGEEGILSQLKDFPNEITAIEKGKSKFILSPMFFTWYGFIEEFGTGGSAFRNFFHGYLLEMKEMLKYNKLDALIDSVESACTIWRSLALKFKSLSENIIKMGKESRSCEYEIAADMARKLYEGENKIYGDLKEVLLKIG